MGFAGKKRADERTRTADLLITSDRSRVAGVCTGLQIPHFYRVFLSLLCPVLHRIALPVVSEWYQEHVFSDAPKLGKRDQPLASSSPARA
jgi:hypothetical protein